MYEGTNIFYQTGIAHLDDIEDAKPFTKISCIKYAYLFPKSFLNWYKDNGFSINDFTKKVYDWIDPLQQFENVVSIQNMNKEVIILKYNSFNETVYNLDGSPLEHMMPFSRGCYMVTNAEYDLVRLLNFLQTRDDVRIVSKGIEEIPWYNRDEDDRVGNYINFYVRVKPDQFSLIKDSMYFDFPKEILDINEYKIIGGIK